MSSTEDFTEDRKTVFNRGLYLRGTGSTVKEKPFIPRRFPLEPLDFNEMKREMEEAKREEQRLSYTESTIKEEREEHQSEHLCSQERTSRRTSNNSFKGYDHDIYNKYTELETIRERNESGSTMRNPRNIPINEDKETVTNMKVENDQNANTSFPSGRDSFDLGVSALSDCTPMKQNDISKPVTFKYNYVTPKVTNIQNSVNGDKKTRMEKLENEKNENISFPSEMDSFDLDLSALSNYTPMKQNDVAKQAPLKKFDNFVTPTVTKIHCSLPRNPPTKSTSTKPRNVISSVLKTTPEDKASHRIKIHCNAPRNTPSTTIASTKPVSTFKKSEVNQNVVCSIPKTAPDDKTFSKFKVNSVEYLVLNILGKGGSSKVYQCFCLEKNLLVALKCVCLENSVSAQGYINEVVLLQKLRDCDRIIKLFDYQILQGEKKLLMVLENGGQDFNSVLKSFTSQNKNIPLYMLIFIWLEMLQAVKQIHSKGIIHSDLKPSNFLCGQMGLKLIDFGISCTVQNDMTSVVKPVPEGSCNYMSPEALNNTASPQKAKFKIHYKSDVWSLGCILYELVYKKAPFAHISIIWSKLAYLMDPNHIIEYPEANWLPTKVINTMKKCLQYDIYKRPSIEELISEYDKF